MGTIRMQSDAQMLGEVVIKSTLPVTRLKGDALVTSVENTVLSKLGSAGNLLSKIPGLISKEGKLEVLGKGSPLFFINGRQVRDQSELDILNAADIRQVEVINNPGAQYDATVRAVVRIRTIPPKGDGFGFDIQSAYTQSENADFVEQVNLNYRHNGLDIFGMARSDQTKGQGYGTSDIQTTAADTVWRQLNNGSWHSELLSWQFIGGLNYQINENHSLGARYTMSLLPYNKTWSAYPTDVTANQVYYDRLDMSKFTTLKYVHPAHLLNAYYNGRIGKVSADWNTDYYRASNRTTADIHEVSADYDTRDFTTDSRISNSLLASKLILSLDLWGGSVSWGGEYSLTKQDADYEAGIYVPPSNSRIEEVNWKVFAQYTKAFGKHYLSAGVRYENVDFDYYENDNRIDEQSRTFSNFFPALSWSANWGRGLQTSLSYAIKTNRPSFSALSSNVSYINRFSMETGNPALNASRINDLTLNTTWRFLQLSMSYRQDHQALINWSKPGDDDSRITTITILNYDKIPYYSVTLSATPQIGIWNPQIVFNMQKQWLTMNSGQHTYRFNDPIFYGAFYNSLRLAKWAVFRFDASYQSKGHATAGYLERASCILGVSFNMSFMNDALNIDLRGTDLLHQNQRDFTMFIGRMTDHEYQVSDTRAFTLTVRYHFNTAKSKYKGTGAGQEEMKRF